MIKYTNLNINIIYLLEDNRINVDKKLEHKKLSQITQFPHNCKSGYVRVFVPGQHAITACRQKMSYNFSTHIDIGESSNIPSSTQV